MMPLSIGIFQDPKASLNHSCPSIAFDRPAAVFAPVVNHAHRFPMRGVLQVNDYNRFNLSDQIDL